VLSLILFAGSIGLPDHLIGPNVIEYLAHLVATKVTQQAVIIRHSIATLGGSAKLA